jgi:hypothetical protein
MDGVTLLVQHVNPAGAGHPDPELSKRTRAMLELGGSYPPWAYATGLVLTPPMPRGPRRAGTPWCLNALSLVDPGMVACRDSVPARSGRIVVLARRGRRLRDFFPIAICISYGQYSVIVVALYCDR